MYVCVLCMGSYVQVHGGQKTVYRNRFSPFIMWVKHFCLLSHLTRSVCLLTGSLRNQLEEPFIKLKHIKNGRRVITVDKKSFL